MRDYFYCWNNPKENFVVFSGVELKDIIDNIALNGGLLLLAHKYHKARFDRQSRFYFLLK